MSETVRCEVCSELYQTDSRDPVLLPCGHTFCRTCIVSVQKEGDLSCPSCSQDISQVDAADLPVNIQALSLSLAYTKCQQESCSDHGDELKYWCRNCEGSLCSLCLYSNHPHGHQVLLAKNFLEERKQIIKDNATYIGNSVKDMMEEVNFNLRKYLHRMKILTQVQTDVVTLLNDLQKACSIRPVLNLEEKLQDLQNEGLSSLINDGIEVSTVEHAAVGGGDAEKEEKEEEGGGDKVATEVVVQVETPPPATLPTVYSRRARLDCRDGRLLLHSLTQRIDSHLSLQLPSEVFLELSNGQRCLGRVYIQLWCHMRRAQQFLALCLGTMGPSLVGAHFRSVSDADKERETIWCTEYASPDGGTGYRELMLDMEWDGEHRREPREGLVVAYSNDVNDYGFGICTKGKPGANFSSPFGEVSSGLEVVRAAVGHEPVTEVTITDCGLVIPDLTP